MSVRDKINFGRTLGQFGVEPTFWPHIGRFPADIGRISNFEISKIWLFLAILGTFQNFFFQIFIFAPNHQKLFSGAFLVPKDCFHVIFDHIGQNENLKFLSFWGSKTHHFEPFWGIFFTFFFKIGFSSQMARKPLKNVFLGFFSL